MTTTLIGLSGSLRRASLNTQLLRAAQKHLPARSALEIESIAAVPLYNGDDESARGIPDEVAALKDAIAAADGLILATPEYNNSVPGVLKNVIDWLSRPPDDIPRVFGGLPVAIMGATPGSFGTVLAQAAWLPVMRTLGTRLWTGGRLLAPRAAQLFDETGDLTDEGMKKRLAEYLAGFIEYVRG